MQRVVFLALFTIAFASPAVAAPDDELLKLAEQLKDKDAKIRIKAAESLRDKGKAAEPVLREICDALLDSNPEVVAACLDALKTIRPELYKPINILITAQKHYVWEVAFDALAKLKAKTAPASNVIVFKVKQLATSNDVISQDYLLRKFSKVLADIELEGLNSASIEFLRTATLDKEKTFKLIQISSFVALSNWALKDEKRDKDHLPLLKAALASRGDLQVEAIIVCGKFGPRAKTLLPELKKLKNSTDEETREEAKKAVDLIEK